MPIGSSHILFNRAGGDEILRVLEFVIVPQQATLSWAWQVLRPRSGNARLTGSARVELLRRG
jgi:hypothetical protein